MPQAQWASKQQLVCWGVERKASLGAVCSVNVSPSLQDSPDSDDESKLALGLFARVQVERLGSADVLCSRSR